MLVIFSFATKMESGVRIFGGLSRWLSLSKGITLVGELVYSKSILRHVMTESIQASSYFFQACSN